MAKLTPGLANWPIANRCCAQAFNLGWASIRTNSFRNFMASCLRIGTASNRRPRAIPLKPCSSARASSTTTIQPGKDLMEVFSRNGIALGLPKQNCCGMPAMEAGDIDLAKRLAKQMWRRASVCAGREEGSGGQSNLFLHDA